ncbi:iron-containing alcohol dehydrogenase [Clostridium sp. KNHs216]|uniref:iron-containing alcohol dehydrogenase n=1 Tax=Clostridium sp. KNHs216 TaxID=1550235 RepID=UPI001152A0D2|nr:iron-containing alcohol dehydrogenase [Clostridium sp. KNHs216]TQI68397.1 glycerol-1-phosphate dehydrogenase [NAD(P)+] [Clostridium sp. KNHs216]
MLNRLPPLVYKYDVGNMKDLNRRIARWSDYEQIPEIEMKGVIEGQNAIFQLPQILQSLGVQAGCRVLAVMDETVMLRRGEKLKELVLGLLANAGYKIERLVLEGDSYGVVHAEFSQVEKVMARLDERCAVLSIGSGVVTDITKHSCYCYCDEKGIRPLPLVSLMTANSVPAYTSPSSIIMKDHVKRTWPSRAPDIILMDIQTLMDCPLHYTVGGVGDLFPVFCAFADWYLADCMGMSNFVDGSWRIMDDVKELLAPYMEEIANRTYEGMEVLGNCLHLTGLTMMFARDSVPMSGYEHVISHMLDMSAAYDKRKTGLHGQQVGEAMILSLINIEKLFSRLDRELASGGINIDSCYPAADKMEKIVLRVFEPLDPSGKMGRECWSDYAVKLKNWTDARPKFEAFLKNWDTYRAVFSGLLPYTALECARALNRSKHPLLFSELDAPITEERVRWAVRNANLMRKRFTSDDLVYYLGWFDKQWEDDIFTRFYDIVKAVRTED